MASDGFTYEREAILNWFQHSNRSPMTNQELDNLELKPNYAIKSIIQLLQNANNLTTNSDKK
jgi:U-box domain